MEKEKRKHRPDNLLERVAFPLIYLFNLGVRPGDSLIYQSAYFVVKVIVIACPLIAVVLYLTSPGYKNGTAHLTWETQRTAIQQGIDNAQCPEKIIADSTHYSAARTYSYSSPQVSCLWLGGDMWECQCHDDSDYITGNRVVLRVYPLVTATPE